MKVTKKQRYHLFEILEIVGDHLEEAKENYETLYEDVGFFDSHDALLYVRDIEDSIFNLWEIINLIDKQNK